MFVALWEYEVKPGCEKRFEEDYRPAGSWARLFRGDSNYRGSRLLRDPFHPAMFVTLDFWSSRGTYEKYMATDKDEYKALDSAGEELTFKERRVGWYEMLEG